MVAFSLVVAAAIPLLPDTDPLRVCVNLWCVLIKAASHLPHA